MLPTDPIERIVAEGLIAAGFEYVSDDNGSGLDFKVGDIHIECKAYHTDRIAEQMSRAPNVIAIQGVEAARWFAAAIRKE